MKFKNKFIILILSLILTLNLILPSKISATTITSQSRLVLTNLNLRSTASAESDTNILYTIPKDSIVTYLGTKSNGYAYVSHNGTKGWVSAKYLAAFTR